LSDRVPLGLLAIPADEVVLTASGTARQMLSILSTVDVLRRELNGAVDAQQTRTSEA